MQQTEQGNFLTTEEVCDLYRISRRTVYRWQQAGKLHGVKVGRRLLFNPLEVMDLLGHGEGMEKPYIIKFKDGKATAQFEAFADLKEQA